MFQNLLELFWKMQSQKVGIVSFFFWYSCQYFVTMLALSWCIVVFKSEVCLRIILYKYFSFF